MLNQRPLGDLRAENDARLLDKGAFIETHEFRVLSASEFENVLVVGRRGTGKSALFRQLSKALQAPMENGRRTIVIKIAPSDIEVEAVRGIAQQMDGKSTYRSLVNVSKTIWRFALLMELVLGAKAVGIPGGRNANDLFHDAILWEKKGDSPLFRFVNFALGLGVATGAANPGIFVAQVSQELKFNNRIKGLEELIGKDNPIRHIFLLIDRVDEGYQPDDTGISIINGLVQAVDEIARSLSFVSAVTFLRDNILRTLATRDNDFTRTFESDVRRLHWDESTLFNFVAERLRLSGLSEGQSYDAAWNNATTQPLHGHSGFKRVLRHTLFRPRDLVALLNKAYVIADRANVGRLAPEHIEEAAREISSIRLDDLYKEYDAVIPGLRELVNAVSRGGRESSTVAMGAALDELRNHSQDAKLRSTLSLYGDNPTLLEALHSVGVFGIRVEDSFTFCHDGKPRSQSFKGEQSTLIHPCYWRALDIADDLSDHPAIHDEYEVEVTSVALELRRQRIREIVSDVAEIPLGLQGRDQLTGWFGRALGILMSQGFRDIERVADLFRVQGRLTTSSGFWAKLQKTFDCRSILFEVYNAEQVTQDMVKAAGSLGRPANGVPIVFICTRASEIVVRRGPALDAIRAVWESKGVIVCHTTAAQVSASLKKLSNPDTDREPSRFLRSAIRLSYVSYIFKGNRSLASAKARERLNELGT